MSPRELSPLCAVVSSSIQCVLGGSLSHCWAHIVSAQTTLAQDWLLWGDFILLLKTSIP